MKNGKFEASDFDGVHSPIVHQDRAAAVANSLLPQLKKVWLAELLEGAPTVRGLKIAGDWHMAEFPHTADTHFARLVDIKSISEVKLEGEK